MPVLLLLHVPPPEASVKVWLVPAQVLSVPLIGDGSGLTVTIAGRELTLVVVGIQPIEHL